jgi:hypothetical protein
MYCKRIVILSSDSFPPQILLRCQLNFIKRIVMATNTVTKEAHKNTGVSIIQPRLCELSCPLTKKITEKNSILSVF